MASFAIPLLTPAGFRDFKSPIYPNVRTTCCTTDTSRSTGCYFFNYHSMRIDGAAFKQKQLVPRKYLIAKALIGEKYKIRETVVPDPDYRIPVILLGLSGALIYSDNLLVAAPIGLLGLLLLFQTTRVRFVFDDEALEVRVGDELGESGENVFVGGKNRWKYSTFVNWELWWPNFPILVYFKETQTKPEGQVHFFPVIFNGKQLYDVMVERAGPSKNSGPK